jgi:hypothetical protein
VDEHTLSAPASLARPKQDREFLRLYSPFTVELDFKTRLMIHAIGLAQHTKPNLIIRPLDVVESGVEYVASLTFGDY